MSNRGNWIINERFSDPDTIRTILLIIRSLLDRKAFSPRPENVVIERVDREPIYPCGRYGPDGLDLSQLEWAGKEGHFWFSGPIQIVRIILDKGSMQGDLELGIDRIRFITSLCPLNYRDFDSVVEKLKEVAQQLELELGFESIGHDSIKLTAESEASLSVGSVNDFVDRLHVLHQSTDI
jgi:hypothetical protein